MRALDEVRAVTGHEIGHYVLKHTWYGILFYSVAAIVLFWLADRLFPRIRPGLRKQCGPLASPAASGSDVRGVVAFRLLITPFSTVLSRTIVRHRPTNIRCGGRI